MEFLWIMNEDFVFWILMYIICFLIIKSDLRYKKIYNRHLVYLLFLGMIRIIFCKYDYELVGLAILVNAGVFFCIYFIGRKSMGAGDVKLAIVLAFWCIYPYCILAIYLSFLFGVLAAVLGIIFFKKKSSDYMPFAPMLICGNIIAHYFFDEIINFWCELVG